MPRAVKGQRQSPIPTLSGNGKLWNLAPATEVFWEAYELIVIYFTGRENETHEIAGPEVLLFDDEIGHDREFDDVSVEEKSDRAAYMYVTQNMPEPEKVIHWCAQIDEGLNEASIPLNEIEARAAALYSTLLKWWMKAKLHDEAWAREGRGHRCRQCY